MAAASRCRPGAQREPLQGDHRVPAPVREPVVAGDDAARVLARLERAQASSAGAHRVDDELVRRQHQPRRHSRARLLGRPAPAAAARARSSSAQRLLRVALQHVPVLGGDAQRQVTRPAAACTRSSPGSPASPGVVPARLLHPVEQRRDSLAQAHEGARAARVHPHPQRRRAVAGPAAPRREPSRRTDGLAAAPVVELSSCMAAARGRGAAAACTSGPDEVLPHARRAVFSPCTITSLRLDPRLAELVLPVGHQALQAEAAQQRGALGAPACRPRAPRRPAGTSGRPPGPARPAAPAAPCGPCFASAGDEQPVVAPRVAAAPPCPRRTRPGRWSRATRG